MGTRATVQAVGLAAGLAGGYALAISGGSAIAPPVFAGSVLVAVVVSQLGRARPELVEDRQPGATASLLVRRVRDYVPVGLARAAVACAAAAIGGLAVTLAIGRFGHSLPDGYYPSNFSVPFSEMGPFWGIGITGLLISTWFTVIAVVLLGALVLWLVARSPVAVGDPDLIRRDERWRQEVATTVTAAVGWVTVVPVAVLLAPRFAARLMDDPRPQPLRSRSAGWVSARVSERALTVDPQWTGVHG